MLSFVQGDEIKVGEVVFPSNATLSARAHGMAAPTLRRHIAQLVERGLVIRRDSPNGKRYARKGDDGTIALAFGFELTPLVVRAAELECMAAEMARDRRLLKETREKVTLLRRDIAGTVECLVNEGAAVTVRPIPPAPSRTASLTELEELAFDLGMLKAEADKALAILINSRNPSGNVTQIERHIQDSNPHFHESELPQEKVQATGPEIKPERRGASATARQGSHPNEPPRIDLPAVLAACPSLRDWITGKVRSWEDLVRAAEAVRPALGISPDAWEEAVGSMGESGAAVTVATILQRAESIASPGGYLRSLSWKARSGQFSPGPIVVSLLRQRAKEQIAG
jgi:replication initiation protein RepC